MGARVLLTTTLLEERTKRAKKELTLFELMGYSYQVIVTNIEWMSPEEVWRYYDGRANVENMIKKGYCLTA